MAFKIIWTKQAAKGYDKIVSYLEKNWSEKEVRNFIREVDSFFEILAQHPDILQKAGKKNNVYKGPINRLTIIVYRVKPINKHIELISIRGSRQKPLKRYPPF
jgi:plasmid stabilization system protein ParE